jgi:hypothetical protein
MNATSQQDLPPDWDPPMPSEAELLAALARSDADLAAGRVVPAAVVHAELAAAIARIEAAGATPHDRQAALTAAQRAELEALAALSEAQINTHDIPEQRDWRGAQRGLFTGPSSSSSPCVWMPI